MTLRKTVALAVAALGLLGVGVVVGLVSSSQLRAGPTLPPMSTQVTVLRPTASVLVTIRDLQRLESASFHMERVIDLTEKQSALFGLIESEDAILLVAAANVSAGVDLGKLTAADVDANLETKHARIALPPAEVLSSAIDSERTYVHTRNTGALARRREDLETRARQEAERSLTQAALEAGLLARAEQNAIRTVTELVRSLGYEQVEVTIRR